MAKSFMQRLFTNGDMSGTNILLSPWIDMLGIEKGSVELRITGTPTGTLTTESTNQPNASNPQQADPNITPITVSAMSPALPAVAGAAVNYIGGVIAFTAGSCRWMRWRYVNSSGVGVLNGFGHFSGPGGAG